MTKIKGTKKSKEQKLAEKLLGLDGMLISFSKSIYHNRHPDDLVVFNSNVFAGGSDNVIWHGDINISEKFEALTMLARKLKKTIAVNYEGCSSSSNAFKTDGLTWVSSEGHYKVVDKKLKWVPERKYNDKEYEEFPAPILEKAEFKKGSTMPFELFWKEVKKTTKVKQLRPDDVRVTRNYEDDLTSYTKLWAYKVEGLREPKLSQAVSITNLGYGPASFISGEAPFWVREGFMYVDKIALKKEKK